MLWRFDIGCILLFLQFFFAFSRFYLIYVVFYVYKTVSKILILNRLDKIDKNYFIFLRYTFRLNLKFFIIDLTLRTTLQLFNYYRNVGIYDHTIVILNKIR